MSWSKEDIENAYTEVRKKALFDKSFRDKVLANPNKAISEVAGKEIPDAVKIKVIEGDPEYHMTFVLPDMVSEELTEEALEKVAGGISALIILSVCAAAIHGGPCLGDVCGAAR